MLAGAVVYDKELNDPKVEDLLDNEEWLERVASTSDVFVSGDWTETRAHYKVDIGIPIQEHTREARKRKYRNQLARYQGDMNIYEKRLKKWKAQQ